MASTAQQTPPETALDVLTLERLIDGLHVPNAASAPEEQRRGRSKEKGETGECGCKRARKSSDSNEQGRLF